MRKIKQKQKQSQSTNINIKIGDTRRKRKRSTKKKPQTQSQPPERVRVITQLVNAPVAPSSTPNISNQVRQGDILELLRKQLQLGEMSGTQKLSEMAEPATQSGRPRPVTPLSEARLPTSLDYPIFSLGGDSFSTPYATTAPFSQFAGADAEASSSSMGMGSSLPSSSSSAAAEQEQDMHEGEPGQFVQTHEPKLFSDLVVGGQPLYDTGFDYTIQRKSGTVSERVYLSSKGAPYVLEIVGDDGYYARPLGNRFGGKHVKAVKDELAARGITYDADAPVGQSYDGYD
jgi:hypothetical protein